MSEEYAEIIEDVIHGTEFIIVPIVFDFDQDNVIGEFKIHKSAVPIQPNCCIALGYKTDANGKALDRALVVSSLVPDFKYKKYLEEKYGEGV